MLNYTNPQSTININFNLKMNKLKKNELTYKKMFHEQEKKYQELQRELDELKCKIQQLKDDNETQETQETQDPYDVTIIRVSPFRYNHCAYLIDSTNVVHTYGDVYNGVDSKPIGKWDPINKILHRI